MSAPEATIEGLRDELREAGRENDRLGEQIGELEDEVTRMRAARDDLLAQVDKVKEALTDLISEIRGDADRAEKAV